MYGSAASNVHEISFFNLKNADNALIHRTLLKLIAPFRAALSSEQNTYTCSPFSKESKMCESSLFSRSFTHFGSFRGKRMAPKPKLRCLYIFQFHFAPLILWPPAYEFCGFSQKRGHRSPCDFTVEKWPRPRWDKKSESTHYQIRQFAQNNTYLDVFQSLLSIQRSPVYYTLSFYYSTKCTTKSKPPAEPVAWVSPRRALY